MATALKTVRARVEEWERWRLAAGSEPFNRWIRRALNSQAELDEALAREAARDEGSVGADRPHVAGPSRA